MLGGYSLRFCSTEHGAPPDTQDIVSGEVDK
jgi:hypothetical protein